MRFVGAILLLAVGLFVGFAVADYFDLVVDGALLPMLVHNVRIGPGDGWLLTVIVGSLLGVSLVFSFALGRGDGFPETFADDQIELVLQPLIIAPRPTRAEIEPEPALMAVSNTTDAFAGQLREYLAANLHLLEPDLRLWDGEGPTNDESAGIGYETSVGRIDILATDGEQDFVVILLDAISDGGDVCSRLLSCVGWVREHLARGGEVRGFLVAASIPARVRYALRDVPSISLWEYDLQLSVRPVREAMTLGIRKPR